MAQSLSSERLSLTEARALWRPERAYLNTASFGLPPDPAWEALQAALEDWRHGRTSWEPWGEATERARAAFGRLVGAEPEHVATSSSVSSLLAPVAAALREGTNVLAADVEFTSLLFPFLAHEGRGVRTRTVPLAALVDEIGPETDLVAVSAVQSSDGTVVDLDGLADAAAEHDALLVVDATQGCGWLPLADLRADVVVCAAYKWLVSPRGTAFMAVRPERLAELPPLAANWWAGEDPFGTYYGPPLRLADSARRLDTSPAWFPWVGTAPALELLERIGIETIHEHDVALANRFRAGLGLPPGDSAIVSTDVEGAQERLRRAGILAAVRAGSLRASFHVYTTEDDVDAALDALIS